MRISDWSSDVCASDLLATADFPVPHVHGLCEDAAVIGSPFYVMDMVEGRIFWDAALPSLAPKERAACYDAMNAAMARLHRVDVEAVGLADFEIGSVSCREGVCQSL